MSADCIYMNIIEALEKSGLKKNTSIIKLRDNDDVEKFLKRKAKQERKALKKIRNIVLD